MKTLRFLFLIAGLPAAGLAVEPSAPAAMTDELQPYAAIGSVMADQLRIPDLKLTEPQFHALVTGLAAAYHHHPFSVDAKVELQVTQIAERIRVLQESPAQTGATPPASMAANATTSLLDEYMRAARANLAMEQSPSGLLHKIAMLGAGPRPTIDDTVIITVKTTAEDAHTPLPQLSAEKAKVKVAEMLPGMSEAIRMLAVGGRIIAVLPPALSFGNHEWPAGVHPGAPLIFDITLDDIVPAEAARQP